MRPARLLVVVLALVLVASASVALARQAALVVRNSTYAHIGRLPNPENDAVDMVAALRRLGFEVTTELDADRVALTEALSAFTRQSAGADVSLVFYAGHASRWTASITWCRWTRALSATSVRPGSSPATLKMLPATRTVATSELLEVASYVRGSPSASSK